MNGKEIMEKNICFSQSNMTAPVFGMAAPAGDVGRCRGNWNAFCLTVRNAISIDGTGRTDAGVHALGQCQLFLRSSVSWWTGYARCQRYAGRKPVKGGDVRITSVREVEEGFHARFSAAGKRYIYRIFCGEQMSVFLRNYRYHVRQPLDTDAMASALKSI